MPVIAGALTEKRMQLQCFAWVANGDRKPIVQSSTGYCLDQLWTRGYIIQAYEDHGT